jgi:outer membrane protein assembly factor BamB
MKQFLLFGFIMVAMTGCGGKSGPFNKTDMDWPLFRGDAALSGYTATRLPDEPALLWTYKGGERTVSSPVVGKGTAYWCDRRGRILGVDIKGELTFEYDLATSVEATPMICDSMLYIGRIDGNMTAISLTRKNIVWNYETLGQVSASPNVVDFENRKAVVFGSYDNYLYCVDSGSGAEIDRFESGYYINGAVALWKGHVIFGGCDSWLRIIDCKTGIRTDSLLLDAYIPASPAVMSNACYVGDYSGNVYQLALENGKFARWKKVMEPTDKNSSFVSVPAVTPEFLYILSDDRHLHAINLKNGKTAWKYMLKGNTGESSPVVCDDRLIVCTKTGIVSILDAATGALEWEYDAGEQIVGSPAVIRNHFFILTAKGTLFCFGKAM